MGVRGQAVLIAATPDDHIKGVDLPPLGVIQRPIAHNCHCPHPRLPEGGAQRVLLHFRATQRDLHCGIDPWHISWRLLQASAHTPFKHHAGLLCVRHLNIPAQTIASALRRGLNSPSGSSGGPCTSAYRCTCPGNSRRHQDRQPRYNV
jgi:hypothetical protein